MARRVREVKPRIGRPPREGGPTQTVTVRFGPEERAEVDAAAERAGKPSTTFIREAALKAARSKR